MIFYILIGAIIIGATMRIVSGVILMEQRSRWCGTTEPGNEMEMVDEILEAKEKEDESKASK